jgi:hypothetical protein
MPTLSRRHLLSLPLFAATLALSTGAHAWSWSPVGAVEGSGKVIEDSRSVPAFQKLRLDGGFDVRVQIGGPAKVVVRADDNLQPLIVTRVEGDTLVVGTEQEKNVHSRSKVLVTVTTPSLSAAALRGSGDLTIDGARGGPFELSLSGSGDVRLGGADLSRLSVALAGSGDVHLQGRSKPPASRSRARATSSPRNCRPAAPGSASLAAGMLKCGPASCWTSTSPAPAMCAMRAHHGCSASWPARATLPPALTLI